VLLGACEHEGPRAAAVAAPAASDAIAITGGVIHTLDPARPRATVAVARGGKLTCVGDASDCEVPRGARVIDLHGGGAVPGLADAHGHVLGYGMTLTEVDLTGCADEAACAARVADRARTARPGAWIVGRGWDQNRWPGARFPTRASLDAVAGDHPVLAHRVDGHAIWVNGRALDAAKIDRATRDPDGGRVVRDDAGAPSGVLVDNGVDLVTKVVPPLSDAELRDALVASMRHLVAVGLTSVHDAGVDARTLAVYRDLDAHGALPLRVYAMLDGQQPMDALRAAMDEWRGFRGDRLTVRAVKLYADGALGSRGAWLKEPYADDPKNTGLTVTAPGELRARVLEVARAGYQPAVHAIGDRACAETLADFVAASRLAKDLRPRVEHLQILDPSDRHLLVDAGAVASMQPTHATSDAPWAEQRLGHGTERQRGAYAWRAVLDLGVPLACGSDFPVEDIDPRKGLFSAETRRFPGAPPEGWMPEQRLTRDEAFRCFTAGAAYAEHAEARRGRIAVGLDADLTVFERDPFAIPADALPTDAVVATIVGGRVEYAR
jgi:predicted amidohydrolase YtcJ